MQILIRVFSLEPRLFPWVTGDDGQDQRAPAFSRLLTPLARRPSGRILLM